MCCRENHLFGCETKDLIFSTFANNLHLPLDSKLALVLAYYQIFSTCFTINVVSIADLPNPPPFIKITQLLAFFVCFKLKSYQTTLDSVSTFIEGCF